MLHADFAFGKTSYDSPLPCEHYFLFLFKSEHASVEQGETFHIAVGAWPVWFLKDRAKNTFLQFW